MVLAFGVEQGELIGGFPPNDATLRFAIFGENSGLLVAIENDARWIEDVFDDLRAAVFCADAVQVRPDLAPLALGLVTFDAGNALEIAEERFSMFEFAAVLEGEAAVAD